MSPRVRRATVLLVAVGCVIGSTVAMAVAQNYPPRRPTCEVSDGTVAPGETITVSGTNWRPNRTVTIALKHDGILGTATTDAEGSFSTQVTIPADAPLGATEIICRGQRPSGRPFALGTAITIVGGGGPFAFTGAEIEVWMILAIALLGTGLALVVITRRRRSVSVRE